MARIKVRLMATLVEKVGRREIEVEAAGWREALLKLRADYEALREVFQANGDPAPSYMLFIDGVDYRLYDGGTPSEIVILPTIHGGVESVDIELVDWPTIEEGIEDIAGKISSSGFKPEVIVGVLRGGVIPARLLADKLGVDDMAVMEIKLYKGRGMRGERPYLRQPPALALTDKRVLIVDDISDSGLTLQLAVQAVNLYMPKEVRTASIYIKPWTEFIPDYYSYSTKSWIVFPWERGEYARGE